MKQWQRPSKSGKRWGSGPKDTEQHTRWSGENARFQGHGFDRYLGRRGQPDSLRLSPSAYGALYGDKTVGGRVDDWLAGGLWGLRLKRSEVPGWPW